MSSAKIAALALAAGSLMASGCGQGSKSGSTSTNTAPNAASAGRTPPRDANAQEIKAKTGKPLSRASWIARGDAICARANVKLSSTSAKSVQDLPRVLPQAAAYERLEATELSKLVPPAGMGSDWQEILTDLQKYSELSIRGGESIRINNISVARPIVEAGDRLQREMVAIAKRDGFAACSIP